MSPTQRIALATATFALLLTDPVQARVTGTVTVRATDVIYAAGIQAAEAGPALGTVPRGIIDLPTGSKGVYFRKITGSIPCFSAAGCIDLASTNSGSYYYNDPDGKGVWGTSYSGGYGSISGITAPGEGYLVGVFIVADGPTGKAPPALNFTGSSATSQPSGYPRLNQVFFIGDGLTGDGTGTHQVVYVPSGAAQLVLGISDSPDFDSSSPGDYNDNTGTYTVDYGVSTGVQ